MQSKTKTVCSRPKPFDVQGRCLCRFLYKTKTALLEKAVDLKKNLLEFELLQARNLDACNKIIIDFCKMTCILKILPMY